MKMKIKLPLKNKKLVIKPDPDYVEKDFRKEPIVEVYEKLQEFKKGKQAVDPFDMGAAS